MKATAIAQASSVLMLLKKRGNVPLQCLALLFTEMTKMCLYITVRVAFKQFLNVQNLSCAKVNCICLLVGCCDNSDKSLESLCSSQQPKLRSRHHFFLQMNRTEQFLLCVCDINYDWFISSSFRTCVRTIEVTTKHQNATKAK